MPQNLKITIICFMLSIFTIPSSAEFFQYVDNRGVTHFTDNISTIPVKFQSQVERRDDTISMSEKLPHRQYQDPQSVGIKVKIPKITELKTKKNILLDQKSKLNQTYESLMAEKQEIGKINVDTKNKKNVEHYNQRVRDINEKIRQFKIEELRFKSEIDKFNQTLTVLETENWQE